VRLEQDPRARALVRRALAGGIASVAALLVVVGLRVHSTDLGYRLDALRGEQARLGTLIRQLDVEVATLKSPARIETRARQLGLGAPAPDQVRLAREYVQGGQGLARVGKSRVVAVAPGADAGGGTPQP
jgi:hypothetical protein